jgi:hypothetical protein
LALIVAGTSTARAAEPRPATLVVDFASGESRSAWFVAALEEMVARELARFHLVELADKLPPSRCLDRASRCLVEQYRAAGVQVVVLGQLTGRRLRFAVYETWTGSRAVEGSLQVAGVTTSTLQRHIGDIVRPIVQRGGLLDERPIVADSAEPTVITPPPPPRSPPLSAKPAPSAKLSKIAPKPATPPPPPPTAKPTPPPSPPRPSPLPYFLLALLLLVALPIGLVRLLVHDRERGKRERPASWTWSALSIAVLAALLLLSLLVDLRPFLAALAVPSSRTLALLWPLASGMIWGAFVLVHAAWVFAPIHGLSSVRHDALWPLLRSWLILSLLRLVLLALFYAPVTIGTLRACAAVELPERVTFALALPAVGMLIYFWLLTLIDNLTLYLDVHLVIGPATARNPWHGTIKRYFRGYVRRNGVELDPQWIERTLFLPSLLPNVISYGGGFARPRILVGEQAREAALGGLPEETEFPERTVNPEELPFGFLVPTLGAAPDSDGQQQARAEARRRELTQAPLRGRSYMPRLLGESATLLGWVLPQPLDEGIPLIANTVEDYDVVKRLLTEHYSAFERNSDDDEVDDTDPTQKDFLFGALIREMGAVTRRDTYLATLWFSLSSATSRLGRLLLRPPIAFYERFLAAPAAIVADAYAALNHGLHHLIQFLCFLRDQDESPLTARANVPRLVQTSRDLLEKLSRDRLSPEERHLLRATPRNRVLWLSQFFHAPLTARNIRSVRVLALAAGAVVAGVLIVSAVWDAMDYHPVYVERMQAEATKSVKGAAPDERPAARP